MEVGSSSALSLEVPAVPSAVASAESDRIKLLPTRACGGEVSSLVFLLLLYLLRFLFFAAWLVPEQAVQDAGLVFLSSGASMFLLCFLSSWMEQESIFHNQTRDLLPYFSMAVAFRLWEQKGWCRSVEQLARKGNPVPLPRRSSLQPRQSSARCFLLASTHGAPVACPVRPLSLLGAPCSSWVFELSHLPGSRSLAHRQQGEGCAMPCHCATSL